MTENAIMRARRASHVKGHRKKRADHLLGEDEALAATLRNNEANGLPPIDVSATQGKMLHLLARAVGAHRTSDDQRFFYRELAKVHHFWGGK